MKRAVALALALLASSALPARADLTYTTHVQVQKTGDATNGPFTNVGEALVNAMVPGGSMDVTTVVGDGVRRIENSKAVPGLPLGSVIIQHADGTTFALNPRDQTYWKGPAVPAALAALASGALKANVSFTRSGESATIAGIRAERVAISITVTVSAGAGVQVNVQMTGDVWLTDQFSPYQTTGSRDDQIAALLGAQNSRPAGFQMRQTLRGGIYGAYEIDSTVTSISEVAARVGIFDVPTDYKEIPPPVPNAGSSTTTSGAPPSQPQQVLFNGATLTGLAIDRTNADVSAGVLRVHGAPGWLHSERPYANFALSFDARMTDLDAKLGVFVRTWPTFDNGVPNNGYRVLVAEPGGADPATGHLAAMGNAARELTFNGAALAGAFTEASVWHHYEITCIGPIVRLIVDGKPVMSATGVDNAQGYIGLRPEAGTVEFRRIAVAVVPAPRPVPPSGVLAAPSAGLQNPQAVKQSKPAYTPQALAARIEGTVLIAGVVQPDGTLQNPRVVQSLDSKLGLDRQALDSLKGWEFRPGTKDGEPVPVMVTISISFALR